MLLKLLLIITVTQGVIGRPGVEDQDTGKRCTQEEDRSQNSQLKTNTYNFASLCDYFSTVVNFVSVQHGTDTGTKMLTVQFTVSIQKQ